MNMIELKNICIKEELDCDIPEYVEIEGEADVKLEVKCEAHEDDILEGTIKCEVKSELTEELEKFETESEDEAENKEKSKTAERESEGKWPCEYCTRKCLTKTMLNRHVRVHTNERPYKCDTCGKGFKQPSNLKTHLLTHSGERPYPCKECNEKFTTSSSLKRHIGSIHLLKSFECHVCGNLYSNKYNLTRHITTHTGERPIQCEKCPSAFLVESELRRHVKKVHLKKMLECGHCDKKFVTHLALNQHRKEHGTSAEKVDSGQCPYCSTILNNPLRLRRHIRVIHGKRKGLENLCWKCRLCGYKFTDLTLYREHRYGHMRYTKREALEAIQKNRYKCKVCSANFSKMWPLFIHMAIHMEPILKCEVCGKNYSYMNMADHNRRNHRKMACDVCHEIFYGTYALRQHRANSHPTFNKSFTCEICKTMFNTKRNVHIHMLRQHKKKLPGASYQCNQCNKLFLTKGLLGKHSRLTMKCAPRNKCQCQICDLKFQNKFYLTRHMLSHRLKKKYECDNCMRLFDSYQNYQQHISNKSCVGKSSGGTYECRQCNKKVLVSSLLIHSRLCYSYRKCRFCGEQYDNTDKIARHMEKFHHGANVYHCAICNVNFKVYMEILEHYKTNEHRDFVLAGQYICPDAYFDCSICNQKVLVNTFVAHSKNCYNFKKCRFCGKEYKSIKSLQDHMTKYHQSAHVYYCTFCNISFKAYQELMVHFKSTEHRDVVLSGQSEGAEGSGYIEMKTEVMEEGEDY